MAHHSLSDDGTSPDPWPDCAELLRQLVAHLRNERHALCDEWVRRIDATGLLAAIGPAEARREAAVLFDNYVVALETGRVGDLKAYAQDLSKRIIQRGVDVRDVLGIVLLLRDVLARSLFKRFPLDFGLLDRAFDAYEPAANRIASTVALSFVEQRERIIRRQQKAIRELHVLEDERKRISRELHDEVGQAAMAINAYLSRLRRDTPEAEAAALSLGIADIEKPLLDAMNRMHSFARELRPAALDDLGLAPALRSYLQEFVERTGILTHFQRGSRDLDLNADQKTTLFRVAQESLHNVAKHARATEVEVSLRRLARGIQLRISDNGRGFQMPETGLPDATKRLGLRGMRERIRLMNGHFTVRSAPGGGTTIVAEIPLHGDGPPPTIQPLA